MKSIQGKKKVEDAENWCFVCKDGGDLRICDDRQCLKSFHHYCVEKDDSFLDSEDRWTCDCHLCFNCYRSSQLQCYTCTKAVCRLCRHESDLLKVKGKYGFCEECLELALLIEEKKDVSSDGVKVDFTDRETYEALFMEYYAIIKEDEGFELRDIYVALDKAKKKKNKRKSRSHSEEFHNDDEKQMSENDDVADEKKRKRKCKEKNKTTPKTSFQMEYMESAASISKQNIEKLSKDDARSIVHEYFKENKHIDLEKKKEVQCDERLKTINKSENHGVSKEAEVENDNANIPSDVAECPFAAVIKENLELVYLKRSMIYELLKEPESFEEKVIGCFVRAKPDPNNYSSKSPFQLMQVKGVKVISAAENNEEIVFLFSSIPNEIAINLLSDGDFSREECEALRQKFLAGQLERPTVVDLQKKAEVIHKHITKHRINKELALLQIKIDQANEKGWRYELFEHRDRKRILQSPLEQSKLFANVPLVIPDTSELESNSGDVKKKMRSDVCSPTSILQCDNTVPGTSEEKAHHGHASPLRDIPCEKGQEDDENTNDARCNFVLSNKKLDHDPTSEIWCILGPIGESFKCSMSFMKSYMNKNPYASEFKVWKEDQTEEDAILLPEAIKAAFPKNS